MMYCTLHSDLIAELYSGRTPFQCLQQTHQRLAWLSSGHFAWWECDINLSWIRTAKSATLPNNAYRTSSRTKLPSIFPTSWPVWHGLTIVLHGCQHQEAVSIALRFTDWPGAGHCWRNQRQSDWKGSCSKPLLPQPSRKEGIKEDIIVKSLIFCYVLYPVFFNQQTQKYYQKIYDHFFNRELSHETWAGTKLNFLF